MNARNTCLVKTGFVSSSTDIVDNVLKSAKSELSRSRLSFGS